MTKLKNVLHNWKNRFRAVSTIELLTAVSVMAVLMTAGYRVYDMSARAVAIAQQYAEAEVLARDLLELTIARRNEDWNGINTGQYYFVDNMGVYEFAAGTQVVDEFTRSVTISEVRRDASGNIVASGGTVDNDMFKLTSTVDWDFRDRPHNVTLEQYITNWRRF